ncbi:MAG TPA: hemerythrin domain-containing protein, partial [Chondromyces sp.]|nr:hemerythrin domain-containing protein [Chondromyces sp.]
FLEDMLLHLEKEEQVVFPYIRTIVACKKNGTALPSAISSIRSPIQVMEEEHQIAGDELRFFRSLTNNYTLPFDACNSYKLLFDKMLAFEEDLFQHIHLENNILFPKALELEKEVLNQLS